MSDLSARGAATLVASWEAYAAGAAGAAVRRLPGVTAAVFPTGPERAVYNNALLEVDLPAAARVRAADAMEAAYAGAGIPRYAAWVHEADVGMVAELRRRGYRVDTCTRAMAMPLAGGIPRATGSPGVAADWATYRALLERMDVPAGLLAGVDPGAFHVVVACDGAEVVAGGIAYEEDGDCGIYNVETLEHARRRGLGTAVTARLLDDARRRGCRTASLQATPAAERLYASLGFRDLGRFVEFVPPGCSCRA